MIKDLFSIYFILVSKFKCKITHAHIHDNDGELDSHQEVGMGSLDWLGVVRKLAANGYRGHVIVESTQGPLESFRKLKAALRY